MRIYSSNNSLHCLENDIANPVSDLIEEIEKRHKKQPKKIIICSQCAHPITTEQDRVPINSATEHTFTNPYGFTFHITCFKEALGCSYNGQQIAADTWFPGYYWQFAICSGCNGHLGWYYTMGNVNYFYGLITSRLSNKDIH